VREEHAHGFLRRVLNGRLSRIRRNNKINSPALIRLDASGNVRALSEIVNKWVGRIAAEEAKGVWKDVVRLSCRNGLCVCAKNALALQQNISIPLQGMKDHGTTLRANS
jgi:hypothetical protein